MKKTIIIVLSLLLIIFSINKYTVSQSVVHASSTEEHGETHDSGKTEHEGEGNSQFFWKTMCFIVIVAVLVYVLRIPMGKYFTSRQETIANEIKSANEQLQTALETGKTLDEKLQKLAMEIEKMKAENERQVASTVEKMKEENRKRLEHLEKVISSKFEYEVSLARKRMMMLTVNHALEIISKKFEQNPDLVTDFRRSFKEILSKVGS